MNIRARSAKALLLCVRVMLLVGCQVHISAGTTDYLTGESYPDAEKYQTGAFTYLANEIKAVEVYWRSGEVEIVESNNAELSAKESGSELPEDPAMLYDNEASIVLGSMFILGSLLCRYGAELREHTEK